MNYSHYQHAIFNWVERFSQEFILTGRTTNLRVDALAGSGKSTTAKHMLKYMPMSAKIGLTAFNKIIADALAPEVKKYHANAEAFTLHSFGYATLRQQFKKLQVNKWKNNNILEVAFYDLKDPKQKSKYFRERNVIGRMISLLKANAFLDNPEQATVMDLATKYGVDFPGDETRIALTVCEAFVISRDTAETHGEIDFDDMVYGPIFYNLTPRQFDFLVVDEFQDFNLAQLQLVLSATRNGNIITFGDPNQSIYNFAGAEVGIMDRFKVEKNAATLPLSICYRCPQSVIREAQKFVPQIEAAPDAPKGVVEWMTFQTFEKVLMDKQVVLCRYTAPLVSWCLKLIAQGRKAFVKGKDIGQNLAALIDRIENCCEGPNLLSKISEYRFREMSRLTELGREDEAEILSDKLEALIAISDGTDGTSAALKGRIESIFRDEDGVGIMFSTIHKAKGLEFPTVYILDPGKKARCKTKTQEQEERNLQYVAITRSQDRLVYVQKAI